ncbi:MAG: hemolysin III family protein [Calditrichaeota bacterium]|nr:MAG: hemolysin III family protein [Calditrichota bacterium]MBL1204902.1 hemolysin III family protein [Calditrichota bacterium]NOG44731.1 hemolysin III family protein [Calditrichota bacterium]
MNGLTHFIGILLAVTGLIVLLVHGDASTIWHTLSFSIFGGAMILLYTASTLYHWLPISGKKLELFRKIDHVMIFVFIAASYTPICLISLRGGWGWSIFGTVWGLTIAGLFLKIFWLNAPRKLYTAIYLAMGWIIIIGIWPLSQAIEFSGLVWMFIGGLFYTTGAIIYALKKPDPMPGFFGFHEIFHVFIMFGSFAHFWMIFKFV